ncbi:MAG: endolytic transglycosylase MltG, partial [Lysobacterales bacterium]
MKRAMVLAAVFVILLAGGIWYVWNDYHQFLDQPFGEKAAGVILDVEPGMSGRAVIVRLATLGVTEYGWQWRILLRSRPVLLKAGEYQLEPGLTPPGMLNKVARGDVIHYRFTIVEGWTWRALSSAIQADPMLGRAIDHEVSATDLPEAAAAFGSLEGAFLPETYLYTRSDSAVDLLNRAFKAMQSSLSKAWTMRTDQHPVKTPYELLVLASIIEKETALA